MAHTKRFLSIFLSAVLALSLGTIGMSAVAAPETSQEFTEEVQDSPRETFAIEEMQQSEAVASDDALFDGGIMDAALDEEGSQKADRQIEMDESADDSYRSPEIVEASDGEDMVVLPKESLGFVYVDVPIVVVGESQSVVVSFADDDLAMEDVILYVSKRASADVLAVEAASVAGPAALFEMAFSAEDDADAYFLSGVQYVSAGQRYYLDLGQAELDALDVVEGASIASLDDEVTVAEAAVSEVVDVVDSGSAVYGFEVVTQDVVNAVGEAMDNMDGDAVLAYGGGDEVAVTDSLEDALDIIDDAVDFESSADSSEGTDAQLFDLAEMAGVEKAYASVNNNLVVAIDPGHGGKDPGASGNGLQEKNLTLSIAQHLYNELRTYSKVIPYMTRDSDVYVDLSDRVQKAVAAQADVFVSVHINSADVKANGVEVWVPNNSTYYKATTADVGRALGSKILSQLVSLGLTNRGVKTRNSESGNKFPDGSIADYYTVINQARRYNIPAIIVEHAFISDASDAKDYLGNDASLKKLGVADATGIAQQYGLAKGTPASIPSDMRAKNNVLYQAHVQNIGWQEVMRNGVTAGTSGRSLRVEALKVSLDNPECSGGIQIRSHVQNIGWQGWVSNGQTSGTTGRSLRIEAVQIRLTGEMANRYDVLYRVHVQNIGWQGWVKNGATAGTTGRSLRVEAIEVKLQKKSSPTSVTLSVSSAAAVNKYVGYLTHVQNIGWQSTVYDGNTAGTSGKSLRLESIQIALGKGSIYSGDIRYRTHVQNSGWESGWKSNGQMSGTTGSSLRLEAIQIELTGEMANRYDVLYRVHVQNIGWQGWMKNGQIAGTTGRSLRLEAIQIKLQEKVKVPIMGSTASSASVNQMVKYFNAMKKSYPEIYKNKGAATITDFANIVYQEASAEGVRPDVVFCQAMWETGWLQFGGDVKADQCNFAGLGATGGGVGGASFADVSEGIRAQVQHLKAYASKEPLKQTCVDPRFLLVTRGVAPYLSDLNGRWAVPGDGYGQNIGLLIEKCRTY